jgi:hypothetical protein
MELSSLTEREEDVPFVSPASCVPLEMGNRGGEIDLWPTDVRISQHNTRTKP